MHSESDGGEVACVCPAMHVRVSARGCSGYGIGEVATVLRWQRRGLVAATAISQLTLSCRGSR